MFRSCMDVTAIALILGVLSGVTTAHAADPDASLPPVDHILDNLKPTHPRLLVDAGAFDALKQRIETDATSRRWYGQIESYAKSLIEEPPSDRVIPDGKRLLSTSREVLRRVYALAMVYRVTGDRRYVDRCWAELDAVSRFKDWNPSHFLDVAEMTHAFAIGYDWLYDAWTDAQRKTIREAIVRQGLTPGLNSYSGKEHYGWWTDAVHNWNQVCNGGLTLGALAVADEEPDIARQIVHGALTSVPRAMREYAPDGAYHEGPSYWGYGTEYSVLMIAGLESALGTDFGLSGYEGFSNTAWFPVTMTGPTGHTFNFADAKYRPPGPAYAMFWLANRFRLPGVTRVAADYAKPYPLDLLWYRPVADDASASAAPTATYWRDLEAVAMRTSWADKDATWVAFKAGSPALNHAHADVGSFVLEALGQRWAVDLGPDNYNMRGYFDRGKTRWTYYRLRAESHNTLVINPDAGPDQSPSGSAKVVRYDVDDAAWRFGVMDLTPVYAGRAVTRVRRGIALAGPRVVVRDEIDVKSGGAVDLLWSMQTTAAVAIADDGRGAVLTQRGRTLVATLLSPADARFSVRAAEPLPTSPNPRGQAGNGVTRTLTIRLPRFGGGALSVLFTPIAQGAADAPPVAAEVRASASRALADW
ncbi:MAG: DUF4962 domain-containing protein [Phycisphaera sp.]|nr:DUF4962 domain-containing protein [Phycisphaera sp.]